MEAIGQSRDQAAEHLRRCREAVQQQDRRSVPAARLAIEDVQPVDLDGLVQRRIPCRGKRRGVCAIGGGQRAGAGGGGEYGGAANESAAIDAVRCMQL